MVDECKKEGWVNVSKIGNKLQCCASQTLVKSFNDYIHFSREFLKNISKI